MHVQTSKRGRAADTSLPCCTACAGPRRRASGADLHESGSRFAGAAIRGASATAECPDSSSTRRRDRSHDRERHPSTGIAIGEGQLDVALRTLDTVRNPGVAVLVLDSEAASARAPASASARARSVTVRPRRSGGAPSIAVTASRNGRDILQWKAELAESPLEPRRVVGISFMSCGLHAGCNREPGSARLQRLGQHASGRYCSRPGRCRALELGMRDRVEHAVGARSAAGSSVAAGRSAARSRRHRLAAGEGVTPARAGRRGPCRDRRRTPRCAGRSCRRTSYTRSLTVPCSGAR